MKTIIIFEYKVFKFSKLCYLKYAYLDKLYGNKDGLTLNPSHLKIIIGFSPENYFNVPIHLLRLILSCIKTLYLIHYYIKYFI